MKKRRTGEDRSSPAVLRLGLTIGVDRILAVRASTRREAASVLEAPLGGGPTAEAGWPELDEVLQGLLEELGATAAVADVALLPPLSRAKVLEIPPVSPSQLDPLVRRNLRRYFAVPYAAPVARARPTVTRSGKVTRAVAVCADAGVTATVFQAVEAAGIRVASMTAAPLALLEGVRRRLAKGPTRVMVTWGARGWAGAMEMTGGVPQRLEDLNSLSHEALLERFSSVSDAGLDGDEDVHALLLTEMGLHSPDSAGNMSGGPGGGRGPAASAHDPWILAAVGAGFGGHRVPSLLPGSRMAELRRAVRRRVWMLGASAAALIALAAGVHGLGLRRELAAVEAARDLIAPQVSRALEVRRTAYAVQDRLEAVDEIERETLRWTPALAALTEVLPRSTYLVSLSTDGFSMRLGGVTRASGIIGPELEDSPYFRDVRLMNVRASSGSGGAGTEFDLSVALQPPDSPGGAGDGGA